MVRQKKGLNGSIDKCTVADAALEKSVAKTHRRSSLNTGSQAKALHGEAIEKETEAVL